MFSTRQDEWDKSLASPWVCHVGTINSLRSRHVLKGPRVADPRAETAIESSKSLIDFRHFGTIPPTMPHQQCSPRPIPSKEVILEIGAECGSLTIYGICDPECGWRFTTVRDETALRDILPEDEQEGLEFYERSGYVVSLVEALGLLECYPWHKLYPLQVHPEFRQRIFDTVISRYASEGSPNDHRIGRWEERCSKVCNS